MKKSTITPFDIECSVWSVPPLALSPEGQLNDAANKALIAHILNGGVTTVLYGGNANLYSAPAAQFHALLESCIEWVSEDTWLIPSVGPDWGRLMDQAKLVREGQFPAAMALPMTGPSTPEGIERGYRDFVEKSGVPLILYIRSSSMISDERLAALIDEGVAIAIKYAVETGDLSVDPFLTRLMAQVPADRIVSGIGEIAAVSHLKAFGMAGFTAGAVCIAPRRAMAILQALQSGEFDHATKLCEPIKPLEDLRNAHGPIQVIHEAVTQSGIADMGPIQPQLSAVNPEIRAEIKRAVEILAHAEHDLATS